MNATFASDRNDVPLAAISLSNGYLQAPSGVYFDGGDYTVMAWIYPRTFNSFSRIIDFSTGGTVNCIVCSLTNSNSGQPYHYISLSSSNYFELTSTQSLQLNKWQNVAFTFTNLIKKTRIYIDGVLVANGTSTFQPNNIQRTSNYIGKSNYGDPNADATFDELKIFSVALTQSQILFEMRNEFYDENSTDSITTASSSTSTTPTSTNTILGKNKEMF